MGSNYTPKNCDRSICDKSKFSIAGESDPV